jgi:DNA-binding transcriptional ArsR family regulator
MGDLRQIPAVTQEVAQTQIIKMMLGELKTASEIGDKLKMSSSAVYRHIDKIRDEVVAHLKDERQHALADHVGKLFEMEKMALENYEHAENSQIKLKWFNERRGVLQDIAKVAGWGGQRHASMMFEDVDGNKMGVVLPDFAS